MVDRPRHLERLAWLFRTFPIVAILGARQVGKTTLARAFGESWRGPVTRFDLERAADLALLADPELALGPLKGLVILDEIQRLPELFAVLRVLVDRPGAETKFLVLGSASPDLLRQSSESLAGRIGYHQLRGFALDEVGSAALDRLWVRGGFPRAFLASGALHGRGPRGARSRKARCGPRRRGHVLARREGSRRGGPRAARKVGALT
jgi:uncharacterized protein